MDPIVMDRAQIDRSLDLAPGIVTTVYVCAWTSDVTAPLPAKSAKTMASHGESLAVSLTCRGTHVIEVLTCVRRLKFLAGTSIAASTRPESNSRPCHMKFTWTALFHAPSDILARRRGLAVRERYTPFGRR